MPELHDALKKEPKIKEWREVVKNEWPPPGMSDGSAYRLDSNEHICVSCGSAHRRFALDAKLTHTLGRNLSYGRGGHRAEWHVGNKKPGLLDTLIKKADGEWEGSMEAMTASGKGDGKLTLEELKRGLGECGWMEEYLGLMVTRVEVTNSAYSGRSSFCSVM